MMRRIYSNTEVAAALRAAGGDKHAAARSLGCSQYVIYRFLEEEGLLTPPAPRAAVRWTSEDVDKLREAILRTPRPSKETLAEEFGTTAKAIQTALSRFNLTRQDAPRSGMRQPADVSGFRSRACMCCSKPFLSEGSHNRMCTECKSGRREAA
jgi:hypothetical protein